MFKSGPQCCSLALADPTLKSIAWVQNQDLPKNFNFCDYGISEKNSLVKFYLPQNMNHVSGSIIDNNHLDHLGFENGH